MQNSIPKSQHQYGQNMAIRTQLFVAIVIFIITGPIMQLFASDVLNFDAKRIGYILGFIPLTDLFRLLLIKKLAKVDRKKLMLGADAARIIFCLIIAFSPLELLKNFYVYVGLLVGFSMCGQLGISTVWQPILRDITSIEDRGRFFARMRFVFTLTSTIFIAIITFMIGDTISELSYRCIMIFAAFAIANRLFWGRKIPMVKQIPEEEGNKIKDESLWKICKESQLLRHTLLISISFVLLQQPIFIIYLRKSLNISSNLISGFVFFHSVGAAISFLIWGRLTDLLGFKPLLTGIIILQILSSPLIFLVSGMNGTFSFDMINAELGLSIFILFFIGVIQGAFISGIGIAGTTILHENTNPKYATQEMSIFMCCMTLSISFISIASGYFLDKIVIPSGEIFQIFNIIHIDWMKIYLVVSVFVSAIIIIYGIRKMKNVKNKFSVGDFFNALLNAPVGSIYRERFIYHEDEYRRRNLAKWYGDRKNPLGIEPLLKLLNDPSCEVRSQAIRSLVVNKSDKVGFHLLEHLKDEERMPQWELYAWALGELEYTNAAETFKKHFENKDLSIRLRSICARSLGKLKEESSCELLVASLKKEEKKALLSSASWGLLQIKNVVYYDEVFIALTKLDDVFDRYELFALVLEQLNLETEWLLQVAPKKSLLGMFKETINSKSADWREKRKDYLKIIEEGNINKISELISEKLTGLKEENIEKNIISQLDKALKTQVRWNLLHVMSIVWLCDNVEN